MRCLSDKAARRAFDSLRENLRHGRFDVAALTSKDASMLSVRLRRELTALIAVKILALALLYVAFFSPAGRHAADAGAMAGALIPPASTPSATTEGSKP
jgi:hypothetical protein